MVKNPFLKVFALLILFIPNLCFAQAPVAKPATEMQSLLSAFVSYTDLRLRSVQQSLDILAATTEAKSAKWSKMQALLTAYQKSDGDLIVWFVRPDGSYYTPDKGMMNVKLSDRAYFPGLMSGERIMGALVVSKATGQRSAVIAVPMKEGSKVIGAIGASVFLDRLAEQVDSALALPADAGFFAMAPDGLTTLNRKVDRHFVDPREVGSETLKRAANEMLSSPAGETTYDFDNAAKRAIYRTSPLTGWKFAITYQ